MLQPSDLCIRKASHNANQCYIAGVTMFRYTRQWYDGIVTRKFENSGLEVME